MHNQLPITIQCYFCDPDVNLNDAQTRNISDICGASVILTWQLMVSLQPQGEPSTPRLLNEKAAVHPSYYGMQSSTNFATF